MAKILIVEDDEAVRSLAARALERAGHEVESAADGACGLARVRAASGGYDLVVSDIRMPVMNGIDMAKVVATEFPDLKVMLITGYAEQREGEPDLHSIIWDILHKPFSLAEMRDRVDRVLGLAVHPAAA